MDSSHESGESVEAFDPAHRLESRDMRGTVVHHVGYSMMYFVAVDDAGLLSVIIIAAPFMSRGLSCGDRYWSHPDL
jgi:hypothetical protein